MKYQCEMIQDLLPLYKDGACSEASKQIVEEHLEECPACTQFLNQLKDTAIDEVMVRERNNVIQSQSNFFKRKSALIGTVIAAIFAIPILVCLIVNLASGHALSWFFIVLAAMLIPTSLFVVPLMAPKNRMFLTMTSFTASVIILLGVICIYTRGSWFFVAASSVLFGLTVCFIPFIVNRRPVNAYLGNFKGVVAMAACTLTFFIMMICIGFSVGAHSFFPLAMSISIPLVAFVWVIFLVIRYLPFNGLIKTGIIFAGTSLFSYFGSKAIAILALRSIGSSEVVVYTEPTAAFVAGGVVIGVIFAIIGGLVGKKED